MVNWRALKYSVHIRPLFCLIQQYQSTLTIFLLLLLSSANNITCIFQIVFVGGNASGEQKQTCSITAVQIGQTVFFSILGFSWRNRNNLVSVEINVITIVVPHVIIKKVLTVQLYFQAQVRGFIDFSSRKWSLDQWDYPTQFISSHISLFPLRLAWLCEAFLSLLPAHTGLYHNKMT